MAVNRFTDMSSAEFVAFFNGLRMPTQQRLHQQLHIESGATIPDTVDWRTKNVVTPVKNQQQCGSCWAFSATGSLEGQHALKNKKLVSLSEQNLVDCSGPEGNDGCEGGLMDDAFAYIKKNKGIDTEASYPYTAEDGNCAFKVNAIGATLKSWTDIDSGSESALTDAIANVGPISVAIDASNPSFQSYSSGVYFEDQCSSSQLDHGVLAVGYGKKDSSEYYLVKNSWGTDWGMDGYILMSRNKDNNCGIATMSSYPVV